MARALLNSLSTLEIVVIFVGGSIVIAIGVALLIRKLVPDIGERQFEDLASGLRVVYELLFALILAFVIASVLDKFNDAETTVATEATALSQLVRFNRAFPADQQGRLNAGIGNYAQATRLDEWPAMREGKASPEAAAALDTMYALYRDFKPANEEEGRFYDQAIEHLDQVATARRDRIAVSTARLPGILVLMLPIGAILLLVIEYRPGLTPRSQAAFMGTLALVLSSSYLLTILLDYPFSGEVSVSNEPLRSGTLAALSAPEPRAPQDGDKPLRLTAATIEGVWSSDSYGTILLRRQRDGEFHGAYRLAEGTVRGRLTPEGTFRGVWCEGSRTAKRDDIGPVEWRLIETGDGDRLVTGRWGYGFDGVRDAAFKAAGGWDLRRLERDDPQDLERRIRNEPDRLYCREP